MCVHVPAVVDDFVLDNSFLFSFKHTNMWSLSSTVPAVASDVTLPLAVGAPYPPPVGSHGERICRLINIPNIISMILNQAHGMFCCILLPIGYILILGYSTFGMRNKHLASHVPCIHYK